MNFQNGVKLYCKSMGKIFKVHYIAKTDEEANEFMKKNPSCAVIACDNRNGLVMIAEKYTSVGRSSLLPD